MTILVTGGTGFIGSHTCVELLEAGYDVVVVDNFVNSKRSVARQVEAITGLHMPVFELDVRDKKSLSAIFSLYDISAVLHFAGLKAVGESVAAPMEYYSANVGSSQTLVEVMADFGVKTLVFSSSATVYGEPDHLPITERAVMKRPSNPYGRSKFFVEEMLADLRIADNSWRVGILRYFNPVGAHPLLSHLGGPQP